MTGRDRERGTNAPLDEAAGRRTAKTIAPVINGRERTIEVESSDTLALVLRNKLMLRGTKISCDSQVCGSCTVLLDGAPQSSCTVLAVEADGREVLTVEGLAGDDGSLHPLQEAFLQENAFQCGYCTAGMLMSAHACLSDPEIREDDQAIIEFMSGTLCRCTGYIPILAALDRVRDNYRS